MFFRNLTFLLFLSFSIFDSSADQNTNAHPPSAFKMRLDAINAEQKMSPKKLGTLMPAYKIQPPPDIDQSQIILFSTNNPETDEQGTNSTFSHDSMDSWILEKISDIKIKLQKTDLNPLVLQTLQTELWQFRGQLTNHRALVRERLSLVENMRTNHAVAATNNLDSIGTTIHRTISNFELQSANPALPSNMRKMYKTLAEDRRRQFDDHQTNAQLWANLRLAQQTANTERVTRSEGELADYLAARLGKIQGKTYPQGMKLDAILNEYRIQAGEANRFKGVTITRIIMFTVFFLPPLVIFFIAFKRHSSK
jgi:hypothetical protein